MPHFDIKQEYSSTERSRLHMLLQNLLIRPLKRSTELFIAQVIAQGQSFNLPNLQFVPQVLSSHWLGL